METSAVAGFDSEDKTFTMLIELSMTIFLTEIFEDNMTYTTRETSSQFRI